MRNWRIQGQSENVQCLPKVKGDFVSDYKPLTNEELDEAEHDHTPPENYQERLWEQARRANAFAEAYAEWKRVPAQDVQMKEGTARRLEQAFKAYRGEK